MTDSTAAPAPPAQLPTVLNHLRFHRQHEHLSSPFGDGGFGQKAETFARFFGTPTFILLQTAIVATWIVLNATGVISWDIYPFILLNLGFSLQAAYAAPLILLAQTRQADRDKAHTDADARHREDLAQASLQRQDIAQRQGEQLKILIDANTALTEQVERLTREIHGNVCTTPTSVTSSTPVSTPTPRAKVTRPRKPA
jgi:uncharacterized membrane protein